MNDKGICLGYQQLTVTTGVVTLTPPSVGAGKYVNGMLIRSSANNLRFTLDGTTPTSSSGFPLNSADTEPLWLEGLGQAIGFKATRNGGSDATLEVLYFGVGQ